MFENRGAAKRQDAVVIYWKYMLQLNSRLENPKYPSRKISRGIVGYMFSVSVAGSSEIQ